MLVMIIESQLYMVLKDLVDNDFDNFVVGIILSFLLGFVTHSSLAHYLPDDWRIGKWLRKLFRRG